MSRCGQRAVTTTVIGGPGITVTGSGASAQTTYTVAVDGTTVAGDGLAWHAGRLTTRLAPGGGLELDPTGALRTTGGGEPGGASGGVTVAALEQIDHDLVGGVMGAGFLLKPPDLLASYTYGAQLGLDLLHVPVRFLSDGTPVVSALETCGLLDSWPIMGQADPHAEHVQDQDPHRWRVATQRPGATLQPQQPAVEDPTRGWFGYLEPGQFGATTLADLFHAVGGRTVLLLELSWPAVDGAGHFVHPTPAWRTEVFLRRVLGLVQQFGLTQSVIVTTQRTSLPGNTGNQPLDVLARFADAGITVGPTIATQDQLDAHPITSWSSSWRWVFANRALPRASLEELVAHTANTVLYVVTRHHLRTGLVNSAVQTPGASGVGAKGVLTADAEYYGGITTGRPFSGLRYRKQVSTWRFGTVPVGLLPAGEETLAAMPARARGFSYAGYEACWMGPATPRSPESNTAWVLHGYLAPNASPGSYWLDWGTGFGDLGGGPYGWTAVAFGVRTDHGFQDPPVDVTAIGDPRYLLDSGYMMVFDTNGYGFLWGFDQGVKTVLGPGTRPYGPPQPGIPQWFRIGVNPNGIKVSKVSTSLGMLGDTIWESRTDLARAHRGGYVYFGRLGSQNAQWEGFHVNPVLPSSGAPPNGPTN
ncbi:hypothetical protein GCM10010174_25710 [Kutzneria viridogrisea]|uniref:Uncharacterized protein n=1 Tax=Kutzneria viridogrisea TaxID=47990 RepID=A0ABR6BS75_9PSEU|nr:hypothetical protein [Kutzneria viridogrisea]